MPRANPLLKEDYDPDLEARYALGCRILSQMANPNIPTISTQLELKYGTLRNRFQGRTRPAKEAHKAQMLLTPGQEQALVDWIKYLASTGHPVCKRTLRKLARDICGKRPSKTWIVSFLLRHEEIKLSKATGLDPRRAQAFNRPVVGRHFEMLKKLVEEHNIPVENIYNMDEKGVQRGGGKKASSRKYFFDRNARDKYKHRSANLELVTIIECVSADGSSISPGFIFSGKEFCPEWFGIDPKISVSMSENGWTDNVLGSEWCQKNFIPQAVERNTSGRPILLIYDGHGSHETTEFIKYAMEHNIILFCLPPHTTHKLQPLDVGVFGPFQRAWIDRCDEIVEDTKREMRKEDFVREYMDIRVKAFSESTIRSAWKSSGAWPINPDVFGDVDYAPSIPYSTTVIDLPNSFPINAVRAMLLHACVDDDSDAYSDSADEQNDNTNQFTMPNVLTRLPSLSIPSTPRPPAGRFPATPQASGLSTPAPLSPAPSTPAPSTGRRTRAVTVAASEERPSKRSKTSGYATWEYVRGLEERIDALTAHCVIAGTQIMQLKQAENARAAKKSGRAKLNCDARTLTSEEGLRMAEERDRLADEKEQEKRRREQERTEKEDEEQRLREAHAKTAVFRGGLASKTKPALKDLAYALGLALDGTAKELTSRISDHFEAHADLRLAPQFVGIFTRTRAPASQPLTDTTKNAVAGPSNAPKSHPGEYIPPSHFYGHNFPPYLNDPPPQLDLPTYGAYDPPTSGPYGPSIPNSYPYPTYHPSYQNYYQ